MSNNKKYSNILHLLLIFVFLAFVANVSAKTKDASAVGARLSAEETYSIAARGLTKKMETDLVLSQIKVKFAKVERYDISRNQIGIRGEGLCQLSGETTDLPINFDVVINTNSRNITEVKYNFVEAAADETNVMSDEETFVTRQLLEKFRADFKTENIVVAIDYLNHDEQKGFSGAAEVKLGDMVWKKVNFEVITNTQDKNSAEVKYKMQ